MNHRAHVYSPLQNIAVWLAAWLHGHVAADEVLGALEELGGATHVAGEHPESPTAGLQFLKLVREIGARGLESTEPVVSVVLSGPGEAIGLPAGHAVAEDAIDAGIGALVFPTPDRFASNVLVARNTAVGMSFRHWEINVPLPAPAYLSPGDADLLLANATREAAALIETAPTRRTDMPNARLTVGTLSDFYDTPGLPFCTPPRAAKLFARADTVAAIIETVTSRVGDRSLDPYLLPLMRHVRAARVAGVTYAVQEFAR